MEEFNVEVSSLKHNFWQILNLSKQLLARNEVLKAKLIEQERSCEWKIAELQKTTEDLKRKNNLLQKKLAIDGEDVSVTSKEYQDVVKETFSHITPKDSYDFYQDSQPKELDLPMDSRKSEENYSESSENNSAKSV